MTGPGHCGPATPGAAPRARATFYFPGCAVCVESDDPAVLVALVRLWPFAAEGGATERTQRRPPGEGPHGSGADGAAPPPTAFRLVRARGGLALHRPDTPGAAPSRPLPAGALLPVLEREIHQHLTEVATDRLLLHAAAVGLGGGAVLLPAPSGSGKTTLAAALVRHGAAYLTDELTVLRADGASTNDASTNGAGGERVEPFPKALSLKDGSLSLFPGLVTTAAGEPGERVHHLAPDELRPGCAARAPLPVRGIVLPRYDPAALEPACLTPLTAGETFLALFEAAANLRLHKQAGLDRLLAVARCHPGERLVFRDLDAAVAAVLRREADRAT